MGQVGPVWVGPDWAGRPSLARPSLGRPSLGAIPKKTRPAWPRPLSRSLAARPLDELAMWRVIVQQYFFFWMAPKRGRPKLGRPGPFGANRKNLA